MGGGWALGLDVTSHIISTSISATKPGGKGWGFLAGVLKGDFVGTA